MSILNGHEAPTLCYTRRMNENEENDFPPIPPLPPMTAEQREMADASIRAAIAAEAERQERRAAREEPCLEACRPAMGDAGIEEFFKAAPRAKSVMRQAFRMPPKKSKASLPAIELPENKPRKPDLHAANLSFAARVIIWVRDRYANNAPAIYKAAYLSRKTYSAIISDENHVVSKRTAVQLAFALRLTREEADLLLHAAGYHLSRSVVEDMVFDACLEAKIYNLEDVNRFLLAYECRPFVPQK